MKPQVDEVGGLEEVGSVTTTAAGGDTSKVVQGVTVSVIIPCRNEVDSINQCIRSLLTQKSPEGGLEVIFADGMSDDGTREAIRAAVIENRMFRMVDNKGVITSVGLNTAIRLARGEIIIRMDAHSEYSEDYIVQCVAALGETNADNVGGPARTKANTYLQRAIAAAYHSPFAVGNARFHDPDFEGFVDTVPYGCWRKELFSRVGYFDEELVRNQDDEHNLRITRSGGKIYQSPRIRSWYSPRGSLTALFCQYMQYGYWKVRVIQKHKLPASWRHLVPGGFLASVFVLGTTSCIGFVLSQTGVMPRFVGSAAFAALCCLLGCYFLTIGVASLHTARRVDWSLMPALPAAFVCYHVGYGYGFLRGIWDLLIWRRPPGKLFTRLTRSPRSTPVGEATPPGLTAE